jgi:hypothetical protein
MHCSSSKRASRKLAKALGLLSTATSRLSFRIGIFQGDEGSYSYLKRSDRLASLHL